MSQFKKGQRWSYITREEDKGSTLVIGQVDKKFFKVSAIHVAVENVKGPDGETTQINHFPFSEAALKSSVIKLLEDDAWINPATKKPIKKWQDDPRAGVFEMTVAKTIDEGFAAMKLAFSDDFDQLVTTMRQKKTDEDINQLYGHLFCLHQWYFLTDPENDQMPLQFVFEDGMNKTPAVLAFTSKERASSAALELGLLASDEEAVGVMSPEVKEAVMWISSDMFKNEWLCFNLTQENFPIYKDEVTGLYNRFKLSQH